MGIVLAAGSGTRFGMPKVLAADWLSRAVDALSDGGCAEVVAEDWADGMAASLRAGLREIAGGGGDPAVVVECQGLASGVDIDTAPPSV